MVDSKDKKEYWVRLISSIAIVISWITFFVIRNKSQGSLITPLTITVIITLVCVALFFSQSIIRNFLNKAREDLKSTKVMSKEEITEILNKIIGEDEETGEGLWNHKKKGFGTLTTTYNKGKNVIYHFKVRLLYPQTFGKDDVSEYVNILINASRNDYKPTVLSGNVEYSIIEQAVNLLSQEPDKSPNVTKRRLELDHFNRPIETTEEIKHPEEKKEEEKRESVA